MIAQKNILFACFAALFGCAALAVPVAVADEAGSEPEQSTKTANNSKPGKAAEDERDYYTIRAQEMLQADKALNSKPHPLAENYPEHYVVVCDGGCKNRQAYIVDMQLRKKTQQVVIGEMVPTAAGGDGALQSGAIECLGGCPRRGEAGVDLVDYHAAGNDWESLNAAEPQGSAGESGRWLTQ